MRGRGPSLDHEEIRRIIRRMLPEGAKLEQMAASAGCSMNTISKIINADRSLRALRKRRAISLRSSLDISRTKIGNVGNVLRKQDPAIRDWLIRSAAKHRVDVSDFIVSCAIDVYYDEHQPKEET